MAAVSVELTEEDRILFDAWHDKLVIGAEVLQDFTEYNHDSKIKVIKKGTKSTGYSGGYFEFYSEDLEIILINSYQASHNEGTYFKKILKDESR